MLIMISKVISSNTVVVLVLVFLIHSDCPWPCCGVGAVSYPRSISGRSGIRSCCLVSDFMLAMLCILPKNKDVHFFSKEN